MITEVADPKTELKSKRITFKLKKTSLGKDTIMPVALGLGFFLYFFGFEKLLPENIGWLMRGDWAQAYLGWEFFRHAEWSFPLGDSPNFFYPHGGNLAYTDSNPLFSSIVKLFFSWMLPEKVAQIFGWWLLVCCILQAYFSNKVLLALKVNNFYFRSLAVLIVLAAPVLLLRTGHLTLCGQWMILMALWNYFRNASIKNILLVQLLLLFFASSTHPYILLMILSLSLALAAKHLIYTKKINQLKHYAYLVAQPIVVFLTLTAFGYFKISVNNASDVNNYGQFGLNLNALINSHGGSRFIKGLPVYGHQPAEGYAYLGLGIILTAILLFLNKPSNVIRNFKNNNQNFPLIIITIALFIFALSPKVVLNDEVIIEFQNLGIINVIGGVFRYSARFVWVAHYLILLATMAGVYHFFKNKKYAVAGMAVICLVQMVDLEQLIKARKQELILPNADHKFANKETFQELAKFSKTIITYPAFNRTLINHDDYIDFSYIAYKAQLPISAGYLARENLEFTDHYKNIVLPGKVKNGELGNALFITNKNHFRDFFPAILAKKANWKKIGEYYAIVSSSNKDAINYLGVDKESVIIDKFAHFLKKHDNNFLIISAKDEATANLSNEAKNILGEKGSNINKLGFRGSYIGIFKGPKLLYEDINNQGSVVAKFAKNGKVKDELLLKSLEVQSAGMPYGNVSKIIIDGQDFSKAERGINVVALDHNMNVIESINIDTHATSKWIVHK